MYGSDTHTKDAPATLKEQPTAADIVRDNCLQAANHDERKAMSKKTTMVAAGATIAVAILATVIARRLESCEEVISRATGLWPGSYQAPGVLET
jgi:hypothetical protein